MGKAAEILADVAQKRAEVAELHAQLEHSVAIQELWPEAFDFGKVSSGLRGSFNSMQYFLRNGKGDIREWAVRVMKKAPLGGLPLEISSDEVPQVLLDSALGGFIKPYLESGYHNDARMVYKQGR